LTALIRMNNLPKHPEGFVIVAGDKTAEIMADSEQEKEEWTTAIKRSLQCLRSSGSSPEPSGVLVTIRESSPLLSPPRQDGQARSHSPTEGEHLLSDDPEEDEDRGDGTPDDDIPLKVKQNQSDWAIVEEWFQDITQNMKVNNEVVKTEVKKVLV